ncbi:MAG: TIR domain-containing protein [Myxococcales bacterium]|nr:TIR domain-containing protein [Myxococcales bacterium]
MAPDGADERKDAVDYLYDVFVSYPRDEKLDEWVHDLLLPTLRDEFKHNHGRPAEAIFVDREIKPGSQWPDSLAKALKHSRILLGIWSAPYFQSAWCVAEWRNMQKREMFCTVDSQRPRLILPIIYHDGKHFDDDAKATMWRHDFKEWRFEPWAVTKNAETYLSFRRAVEAVATDLDEMIAVVPPWSPAFPIELPTPHAPARADLPRLHE